MEQNPSSSSIANDVLHNPDHSKLSQEEINKAVAHHNRRHSGEEQGTAPGKPQKNPRKGAAKPK
jgi:hypothetical protein